MKKRTKILEFYKNELIEIYKIIIDDSIEDKEAEITKIGSLEKLDSSLKKGFYTGIDKELNTIKEWFNEYNKDGRALNKNILKGNQYSEKQVTSRIQDLLYLNNLYENNLLNENTYYPVFKKLSPSKLDAAPSFSHLLKSKNIPLKSKEMTQAFKNVEKIEKAIEKFHRGRSLKNLKYRRVIEETLENNNYLENYNYAEFLITTYINSKSCYRVRDFISYANISEDQFNDCVNIIGFLNPTLYQEYLDKKAEDNKKNIVACNYTFIDLANSISEYRKEGKDMPRLEFLTKAPFLGYNPHQKNYRTNYASKVSGFIADQNISKIIISYLYRNKINNIQLVNINNYLNNLCSVNGYTLTQEDKENIRLIMKSLNIVTSNITLINVIKKYLNNEYDLEELQKEISNPVKTALEKNPYVYKK